MAEQPHYAMRGSAAHARSIGITQRSTPLSFPWTGELRVRFSDFQVNEINPDGKVLHLTTAGIDGQLNASVDSHDRDKKSNNDTDSSKQSEHERQNNDDKDKAPPKKEVSTEDVTILIGLGGQSFADEIVNMYQEGPSQDPGKKPSVLSEPLDDKPKRGQIHQEVRRIFKSAIETTTNASGAIVATFAPQKGQKRSRGGVRSGRHKDDKPTGEHLHFTLFKDNRDTMDAINQIARMLRVKPQIIGYAGTKDRRASTSQRCSVRYTRKSAMAGINGRIWGVTTGDYEYHDDPIHLGQLRGNEFVITIKNCDTFGKSTNTPVQEKLEILQKNVDSAMNHLMEHGWINYFGHQRFGTHDIGTHQIGKLILGEKFEEAVKSLLAYDPQMAAKAETGEVFEEASKRDEHTRHQACMLFMTGQDPKKAAEIMPRRFTAETCILRHLNRQGSQSANDFVGSILHITRGLRTMYVHAYQSHIWNHVVSRRWELYGEKLIKGDLIIVESDATPLVAGQDQDGDDIINPVADDEESAPVHARPLTEEEVTSGQYTIHDIVLPTPGFEVIYPDNDIGEFYKEFMGREENGSLDPNNMRRRLREFSLPGRYRKVMNTFLAKPSVELKVYSDDAEQMHPTDLDVIKAANKTAGHGEDEQSNKKVKVEEGRAVDAGDATMVETQEGTEGDSPTTKIAAVVKFQLGSSAYATVTLRELMGDPPEEQ